VYGVKFNEKFYPSHFCIANGYLNHKWFNGTSGQKYPAPLTYGSQYFRCSSADQRIAKLQKSSITNSPSLFNGDEVLWIGSYLAAGTNSARDMGRTIKRFYFELFIYMNFITNDYIYDYIYTLYN